MKLLYIIVNYEKSILDLLMIVFDILVRCFSKI